MNLRFITPLRDVIGTNKSPWLLLFFILVNMFIIISCSLQLQHFRVNTIDLNIFFQMINISCFERFKNCEAIHMGIIYKIHHQVVCIYLRTKENLTLHDMSISISKSSTYQRFVHLGLLFYLEMNLMLFPSWSLPYMCWKRFVLKNDIIYQDKWMKLVLKTVFLTTMCLFESKQ